MKKLLGVLGTAVFVVVVLIAGGMGKILGRSVAETAFAPDKSELVDRTVQEINKSLPMMVDKETRFDRAAHGQGDTIEYHYTILTLPTKAVEPQAFQNFEVDLRKRVCGSSDMRKVFSADIGAQYIYKANDQAEIGRIIFTPSDCANNSGAHSSPSPIAIEAPSNPANSGTSGSAAVSPSSSSLINPSSTETNVAPGISEERWRQLISDAVTASAPNAKNHPYVYWLSPNNPQHNTVILDKIGVDLQRGIQPHNTIAYASPLTPYFADLVVNSFNAVQPASMPGVHVIFIGAPQDNVRVASAVKTVGADYTFVNILDLANRSAP